MTNELVDGEHYWLRPKMGFDGYDEGRLIVGRYNKDGWTHPIFNLCGDDLIHDVYKFDVVERIKKPDERS